MPQFPFDDEIVTMTKYYPIKIIKTHNTTYYELEFRTKINVDKQVEQLDSIFSEDYSIKNQFIKQLFFNMFFNRVLDINLKCSDEFIIDYIKKLKSFGMKFYWIHLIKSEQSHFDLVHFDLVNDLIINLGVENPNQVLYSDLQNYIVFKDYKFMYSYYCPLYSLVKVYEEFLNIYNPYCDLNLLMRNFDNYIKIGCDPNYTGDCHHYNAGTFPIGLSRYVNPSYEYNIREIKSSDLIILANKDLNINYYLSNRDRNLSLLKFILHVADTYIRLNYLISYDDLGVKITFEN